MKLTGLSISFCVRDICDGHVAYDDVQVIIAGTACSSEEDWRRLEEDYSRNYWHRPGPNSGDSAASSSARHMAECVTILRRLREEGKVLQPRVGGGLAPNIADGWWVMQFKLDHHGNRF